MQREELTLLNRQGKRMPATLYTPEGAVKGTCVAIHGLGGWKDQKMLRTMAEATTRTGYQTLTFDEAEGPNGPDAGHKVSTTSGFYRDLEDVIAYLPTTTWHRGELVLAGHSLGALIAAHYAVMQESSVDRLIMVAPALTWRTYPKSFLLVALWWLITGRRRLEGPKPGGFILGRAWLLDFMHFDAYTQAHTLRVPTLVVMGEVDGVVGTVQSHARYTNLLPHGTYKVISGADHDFVSQMDEVADTITAWLTSS